MSEVLVMPAVIIAINIVAVVSLVAYFIYRKASKH